jgi:hypothetical protein
MLTQVAGFVLRAKDRHLTARFYSELGLITHEHQHGGPKHYEMNPLAEGCIVEVYTASELFQCDALMLNVASIATALEVAAKYDIAPQTNSRETADMKFVYIKDPDGRVVMLIEKK